MPTIWSRATGRMCVLLLTTGVASCTPGGAPRPPAIGAAAPQFEAMDLTGRPVSLASLRGQVVVLNVWATWCLPCRDEIPVLKAAHQALAGQGVQLIGVSVDAAGAGLDVQDFALDHGITYPLWLDPEHRFATAFLTVGVPETFVIDRAGIIRHRVIGALPRGDTTLTAAIRAALRS